MLTAGTLSGGWVSSLLLQLAEPLADARVGRALVDHPRQHRELVGAMWGGFRRHRHALIPAQHACD
jgi:hypothetical protein